MRAGTYQRVGSKGNGASRAGAARTAVVAVCQANRAAADTTLVFQAACGDSSSASARMWWVRGTDVYWDSVMGYRPATALSLARAERSYS